MPKEPQHSGINLPLQIANKCNSVCGKTCQFGQTILLGSGELTRFRHSSLQFLSQRIGHVLQRLVLGHSVQGDSP